MGFKINIILFFRIIGNFLNGDFFYRILVRKFLRVKVCFYRISLRWFRNF